MNKQIEEMAKFMLEKSNSANAEPIFTAEDGTVAVLGENMTKVLDAILEQAFIPFLAECLVKEGYRKASDGEWVDQYKGKYANALYKCSACGGTARIDQITSKWILTSFCPHCGAKMKGE